jgi:hypothetical protein
MNNKLTTPKGILIGSFMIAGTILYTNWNISNPVIRTAQAEINSSDVDRVLKYIRNTHKKMNGTHQILERIEGQIKATNMMLTLIHNNQ